MRSTATTDRPTTAPGGETRHSPPSVALWVVVAVARRVLEVDDTPGHARRTAGERRRLRRHRPPGPLRPPRRGHRGGGTARGPVLAALVAVFAIRRPGRPAPWSSACGVHAVRRGHRPARRHQPALPLFGISNQLLAAIALTLCVTLLFKHGKAKWGWVPGIALAWDLSTTMTASWQKVFSDDPRIRYFEQRATFRAALDDGEILPPAADLEQMQQIVTNSTVNGVLQALFAVLTLVVVVGAIPVRVLATRLPGADGAERRFRRGAAPS